MADLLVKLWLSFFSLSKIILVAKRPSNSTFESIVSRDPDLLVRTVGRMADCLPDLVERYTTTDVTKIDLSLGLAKL